MAVWSALAVPSLGVLYLLCGAVGLFAGGEASWQTLLPAEPYVTICRALMLAVIPALVIVFASVHTYADSDRRLCSLTALAFALVFATMSSINNILLLGVARLIDPASVLGQMLEFRWPLPLMVLELFAWGPLLGLALLFAAPVFRGDGLHRAIRIAMLLAGILCLFNILCFVFGDASYSIVAVVGYDFVLPAICVLLAILFARSNEYSTESQTRLPT